MLSLLVLSMTICVDIIHVNVCVCHVRVSIFLSLSLLFHFLSSIIFKGPSTHLQTAGQKVCCVSLSHLYFSSFFPPISLSFLQSVYVTPISPHLVHLLSPLCFQPLPSLHHSVCASISSIAPQHQHQ